MPKPPQTTTDTIPAERRCPRCGAALEGFGPDGLCGACLLESASSQEPASEGQESAGPGLPRFGDYELLGEIARGGMGVVYRARQAGLNRVVALKMILGGQLAGSADVKRFRQEAEAAAQLKHPNIVAIHEVGERDGQPFFSMDFIEGQTLRQLTRDNPLPAAKAAALLKTTAEAVHYAHERGVVHRDLKPGNVLVDAAGQPHVTDFGLAKRIDSEADLTLSGAAMGTPGFMAPEQASGQTKTVGPLADVYALGAMLYDLLTGRPPHRAETPLETMAQTVSEDPITPRLLNASIPRDLETICLKCLEKEPARRYSSAAALAEDLGRHLNHEPIHAIPPTRLYRARKFVRRHRAGVAVAAGFALVLATATVVSTAFGVRANGDRRKAVKALRDSEEARQHAEAVSKFMVETLRRPNPEVDGRDLKVVDLLDQAATDLQANFAGAPRIKAELLEALGQTFIGLDLRTNAAPLLANALRLRIADLGPNHRSTLRLMQALAKAERKTNRTNATALLEETWERQRMALGPNDPDTLQTMCDLAHVLHLSLRDNLPPAGSNAILARATTLYEEAERRGRAALDRNDPCLLFCISSLGQFYLNVNRLTNALPLLEEAVRLQETNLPADHPHLLGSMTLLGDARFRAGQTNEALVHYEAALAGCHRKLSPGHARTLGALDSASGAYHQMGRWTNVVNLLEDIVELRRLHRLPDATAAGFMRRLSFAYNKLGRDADAARVTQEELDLLRSFRGEDDPETFLTRQNLTVYKRALGMAAEVLSLREQTFKLSTDKHGPTHPTTLEAMRFVGISYGEVGRLDDALQLFQDLLRVHSISETQTQRELPANVSSTVNWLASVLNWTNKNAQADQLLRDLIVVQRKRNTTGSTETLETRRLLGFWSRNAGRVDEALLTFHDMLQQATNMPSVPPTLIQYMGDSVNRLAEILLSTNRFAESSPLLRDLLVVQLRGRSNATEESANTRALLGRCCLHETNYAAAERYLDEAHSILKTIRHGRSQTYTVQGLLGEAQLGQRKFKEAEANLLRAYAGLEEAATKEVALWRAQLLTEATERLVRLYDASGQASETKSWEERLRTARDAEARARDDERLVDNLSVPPAERRANTTPVDLTQFYNGPMDRDWLSFAINGLSVSNLLAGERVLGGVDFDVRGILQLAGTQTQRPGRRHFASETNDIPVGLAATRLHFLLGTAWKNTNGAPIGSFVIHFTNKDSVEVPIIYGDHVRDMVVSTDIETRTRSGRLAVARKIADRGVYRAFTFAWENPHPSTVVRSFDFKSKVTECAPFLLGVTAERDQTPAPAP